MSFTLTYKSDFSNPAALDGWVLYNGVPSCCPSARWAKSQVVLDTTASLLTIRNTLQPDGTYLSGGMSMARMLSQTYGKWSVKFRFDGGVGIKMVALLWQQAPASPPDHPYEIDFVESSSADLLRTAISATLHHPPGNSLIQLRPLGFPGTSLEDWHTWSVSWTPGRLVYRLDGQVWGTTLSSDVPSQPMHMAIQTTSGLSNGGGAAPTPATPAEVDLQIASIRVWSYQG